MAILLSNFLFPFPKQFSSPLPYSTSNSWFQTSRLFKTRNAEQSSQCQVISRTRHSYASIEEHEQQQQINMEESLPESKIADSWREIHGSNDWTGLLDPMNDLLRSELIRYGEMSQSCYDAFDYDPFSKYCGSCRFSRGKFFERLGMENVGYEVTRYLYATSNINMPNFFKKSRWPKVWSKSANWIGYVAVSNDEKSKELGRRDIVVAWRGTVTRLEWITDLMDFLKPIAAAKIGCPNLGVKVESGFVDLYTEKEEEGCGYCRFSAREQVMAEVKRLTERFGGAEEEMSITITGHSLGSALAVLSAFDLAETGLNRLGNGRVVPVCVFSFSGPRVGNFSFKERLHELGVKVLRVINIHDIVPKSPGFLLNESIPRAVMQYAEGLPWSYSHVGVELKLDHKVSPFLKQTNDPVCAHNLEALLHLLDGYHEKDGRFVLASGRDPALVNKGCDFLKDHYLVPPNWRQDENKGMIRNKDGRWIQPDRLKFEDHPHDIHHHLTQLGLHFYS
ncbi:phospholipase A1-Igamma1, chloroplastic [Cucumis sativus]|uniref:Fungal lipase-type domain-containing protein n=1 Tax=Cucumis sativus TaxID=3659 RepID=A0A0A0K5I4_CUCSA|nr:phospholipase A1-Igamma1, chloroplastic [Cucumis sativus]KGN44758.1 hypothetical protein Csa_016536 [Cucumis sativus]